jgi:hypothetical protein
VWQEENRKGAVLLGNLSLPTKSNLKKKLVLYNLLFVLKDSFGHERLGNNE